MLPRLYVADLFFKASGDSGSPPLYHGARWHAWLREAARGSVDFEAAIFGLFPMRSGRRSFAPGETVVLRLILTEYGRENLDKLTAGLASADLGLEFGPGTLRLELVNVNPVLEEQLNRAAAQLRREERFAIDLLSPLRLVLPPGKKSKDGGRERYCPPEFFDRPEAPTWLLSHVRPEGAPTALKIASFDLAWRDLRYSRDRRVALGGVVGKIAFAGRAEPDAARAIALGSILGAGKNPRFGLGFWRVLRGNGTPLAV